MSRQDSFQIVADQITLIRREIADLQRTSLNKDEAGALHRIVARGVEDMREAVHDAPTLFARTAEADRQQFGLMAADSAREAALAVMSEVRDDLRDQARNHAQAAGEARREAWRRFGGFWVWLASVGATGALLGALAAFWIGGTISAREFGDHPNIFCGSAGGQRVTQNDGSTFCAVWIDRPDRER